MLTFPGETYIDPQQKWDNLLSRITTIHDFNSLFAAATVVSINISEPHSTES